MSYEGDAGDENDCRETELEKFLRILRDPNSLPVANRQFRMPIRVVNVTVPEGE